jgi:hypothetical protein
MCRSSRRRFAPSALLRGRLADGQRGFSPSRKGPRRLAVEQLESRTLLSAAILGNVWNDLNGDGVRQAGEPGLAGQTVFLDLNHDGKLGSTVSTVAASSTAVGPTPGQFGSFGFFSSTLQTEDLAPTVLNLSVTMDLANNGPDPVQVSLLSPLDQSVLQVPVLFTIQPGSHFVGTFDGNSTNPVTLAPSPLPNGTYAPQMAFASPQMLLYNGNPNGTWALTFLDLTNPGRKPSLTLTSWSLSVTQPEPSTHTDAAGNYSFQGLAPGTYHVSLALSAADAATSAGGATRSVQVAADQAVNGVNFGVRPAPDLTGVSFRLAAPATAWGQPVTVRYTLTNQGLGDAPAFDVGLYLSADGVIGTGGRLLDTLHIDGLAAGASVSGSVTVTLPSGAAPGSPPPGFGSLSAAYLGFVIDPSNAVAESDEANNSNQGAGIDLAALAPPANNPVAAGPGVQQAPAIAVDPANANHLVAAYMDYSLLQTGYAGIGVATSNDGGKTWTQGSVPLPAGFDQGAAAPSVAFDGKGNVYVSFMAATFLGPQQPDLTNPDTPQRQFGFQSNNGVFVARSGDGGLTWNQPVAVEENLDTGTDVPFDCFPAMAVDSNPSSPNFGSVYVTWARYYPAHQFPGDPNSTDGSDVMFAVSGDGGSTWATQLQTVPNPFNPSGPDIQVSAIHDPNLGFNDQGRPGRGFVSIPSVAVGAGGAVYVATFTGNFFTVYSSTNGGRSTNLGTAAAPFWVSSFVAPDFTSYLGNPFNVTSTQVLPDPTLGNDSLRTIPTRQIAADPTRPGVVYAVAENSMFQTPAGAVAAQGILFAVSTDYGRTWTSNFTVGSEPPPGAGLTPGQVNSGYFPVLNDDNGGQDPVFAPSQQNQVISGQGMPSITVNAQGVVSVIWYDTRSDPSATRLQVWGTTSTDGGQHFSANFPVTDASFDPNAGGFTAATGRPSDYFGDQIGLVSANGTAYAVWTDTRGGTQDVFFDSYALTPAPQPPADRFAPNDTPQTATDLGSVTAQQVVPRLTLPPGGADEWFRLQAGATGALSVSVTAPGGGSALRVELTDAKGNVLPAVVTNVLDASGAVIGQALVAPGVAGQTYLVHVSGDGQAAITYTLTAGALTADLGTQVEGTRTDALTAGGQADYRLTAGVTGSLVVTLTSAADVHGKGLVLQILSADGQTVLAAGPAAGAAAGGSQQVSLPVTAGEVVLLQVSGADAASLGHFTLQFTNLDQFEAPGAGTLFFPTQGDPTSVAVANLGGPSSPASLLVTNTDATDSLGVLQGNGDGTFQSPRQFDLGPGLSIGLIAGNRQIAVANLTGADNPPDVIVPNFRSADVSVLLGNGDGTFQPQRRFNAVPNADWVVTGDVNGDGKADAIVLENFAGGSGASQLAVLLGRGDGTFLPPKIDSTVFTDGAGPLVAGDFNGDGKLDVIVFSKNDSFAQIFFGNGDGTFPDSGTFATGEDTLNAAAVDLNGDGKLDLVTTGANSGNVYVMLGNGDGTFQAPQAFPALAPRPGQNVSVQGLAVVDFGSPPASGSSGPGPADGHLDLVVTAAPRGGTGGAEVILLPGLVDAQGHFAGFGAPQVLATVGTAGNIAVGHFTADGTADVAVADKGGVTVVYGRPPALAPNTTPQTARDLGSVAHLVTLPQAIVTGHEDAYYTYTVPTEAARGSGAEAIDFSALFQDVGGAGLGLEVSDAATGQVLGSGDRVRVVAAQGEVLTVRVHGLAGSAGVAPGFGAYALDIDVLPQVVSVQAEAAVPGGPATSLVLTFQGDRLDPASAEDPVNYTVTWLGPDGKAGTADDQVIPIATTTGAQPVVYDPGANVDVASGLAYPTAVRQTVTLLFANPLPAGSYLVTVSPAVHAASFSGAEGGLLAGDPSLLGHPVVSARSGSVNNGSQFAAADLVAPSGAPGNLDVYQQGTPFLTQLQNDLAALLDSLLAKFGDDPRITDLLNQQIAARFGPAALAGTNTTFTIIWLDPVSLDVQSPQGTQGSYNAQTNQASNNLGNSYVDVAGNVEVVVMANVAGSFRLGVADVPAQARGGAVVLGPTTTQVLSFTDSLREGVTNFLVNVPETPGPTGTSTGQPGPTSTPGPVSVVVATPGPASATPQGSAAAGNAVRQAAAAVVVSLLTGLPANATLPATEAGPGGTTSAAGGPAAGAVGTASAAGSGGGDERKPSSHDAIGQALNQLLHEWLPAAGGTARDYWQMGAGVGLGVVEEVLSDVGAALSPLGRTLGWDEMPAVPPRWQHWLNDLGRYGMDTAQQLLDQVRSRANGPNAPAAPAPAEGQHVPAPMEEEEQEESLELDEGSLEAWLMDSLPRRADAYWGLTVFLAGASLTGAEEAAAGADDDRKKHRAP